MLKYALIAVTMISVPCWAQDNTTRNDMAAYGEALAKCGERYGVHAATCIWAEQSIVSGRFLPQSQSGGGNEWLNLWKHDGRPQPGEGTSLPESRP